MQCKSRIRASTYCVRAVQSVLEGKRCRHVKREQHAAAVTRASAADVKPRAKPSRRCDQRASCSQRQAAAPDNSSAGAVTTTSTALFSLCDELAGTTAPIL